MARRPIFLPKLDPDYLVFERYVDFHWSAGMAVSQKQKSIADLHHMAFVKLGVKNPLEVSSKSTNPIGVALSSFNLSFVTSKNRTLRVENAFQGSKVFQNGGPFIDLFDVEPMVAKRDDRLKNSGDLIGFEFFGQSWPTTPLTCFYDWIYINALHKNERLASDSMHYDGFTDIEFNPEKSINCQARSVALYQALRILGKIEHCLKNPINFISIYNNKIAAEHFYKIQKTLSL